MATHVVIREFGGAGDVRYSVGQAVNASGWPNVKSLTSTRYIRERTVAEAATDNQSQVRPIRQKG